MTKGLRLQVRQLPDIPSDNRNIDREKENRKPTNINDLSAQQRTVFEVLDEANKGDFERSVFNTVMKEFEMMTCVQFVNRSNEQAYISIESGSSCWSYVGKIGGKQIVSLSMSKCISQGLIQHELVHTLGFYHEHTRKDRDNYIDISWENIAKSDYSAFNHDKGDVQNLPYDYNSIMHYSMYAFSNVSGRPSMVPKSDPTIPMGKAIGINNLDVMKINSDYNCGKFLFFVIEMRSSRRKI
ncbi:astacin-like metalloendopeptidase [Rhinoderma darwinii]|uniref:astacin-like metalloendopeptidase n=1 Tax=Rhinoderma darwinii TaxID=43563 RepID=UPI003F6803E2